MDVCIIYSHNEVMQLFLTNLFSLVIKPFINKNIDSLKIVTISKSGVRYMENQFYEGILQTLLIFVDDKDV